MRPLFTIHAGELLVGEHIERHFPKLNVWIPTKDTGVDLLVTDRKSRKMVSLQVKLSRDYEGEYLPSEEATASQHPFRATGWWTFDPAKIRASSADYWVLALIAFAHRRPDYIVVPPAELYRRLKQVHRGHRRIQTYFSITRRNKCWETRGLGHADKTRIAAESFNDHRRNFTSFLNNWTPIARLARS